MPVCCSMGRDCQYKVVTTIFKKNWVNLIPVQEHRISSSNDVKCFQLSTCFMMFQLWSPIKHAGILIYFDNFHKSDKDFRCNMLLQFFHSFLNWSRICDGVTNKCDG